jgi:hypothetical protein
MSTAAASDESLDAIYDFAIELGKAAGDMLLERAKAESDIDQDEVEKKMNAVDLVTKTDKGPFTPTNLSPSYYYNNTTITSRAAQTWNPSSKPPSSPDTRTTTL